MADFPDTLRDFFRSVERRWPWESLSPPARRATVLHSCRRDQEIGMSRPTTMNVKPDIADA
jgi:hypothetical protein